MHTRVGACVRAFRRRRRAVGEPFAGGMRRLNSISDRLVHTFRMWAVEGTVVKTPTPRRSGRSARRSTCKTAASCRTGAAAGAAHWADAATSGEGPAAHPPFVQRIPLCRRRFSARSLASRVRCANVVYRFFCPAPVNGKYCSLDLGETSLVWDSDDKGYFRHLFCALKEGFLREAPIIRSLRD